MIKMYIPPPSPSTLVHQWAKQFAEEWKLRIEIKVTYNDGEYEVSTFNRLPSYQRKEKP